MENRVDEDAMDLLKQQLKTHPTKRIPAKVALKHPWLTGKPNKGERNILAVRNRRLIVKLPSKENDSQENDKKVGIKNNTPKFKLSKEKSINQEYNRGINEGSKNTLKIPETKAVNLMK